MRHRDDIAAAMHLDEIGHGGAHPRDKIGKTFAAGCAFLRRSEPKAAQGRLSVGKELGAIEPLPFAEILLRESGDLLKAQAAKLVAICRPDRPRSFMRTTQIARNPHRVA